MENKQESPIFALVGDFNCWDKSDKYHWGLESCKTRFCFLLRIIKWWWKDSLFKKSHSPASGISGVYNYCQQWITLYTETTPSNNVTEISVFHHLALIHAFTSHCSHLRVYNGARSWRVLRYLGKEGACDKLLVLQEWDSLWAIEFFSQIRHISLQLRKTCKRQTHVWMRTRLTWIIIIKKFAIHFMHEFLFQLRIMSANMCTYKW